MNKVSLDKETILNAAEGVIRRFGPDKANISDVAKSLQVSHAAIYRYFNGKSALWSALIERWLVQINTPLNQIIKSDSPPDIKLRKLLEAIMEAKRRSAANDAEMFAHYMKLYLEATEVIEQHISILIHEIEQIIEQGIKENIFFTESAYQSANAVFMASQSFLLPNSFGLPDREKRIKSVIELLLKGLKNPKNY